MRLYTVLIPVYNRPDEVDDLLNSLVKQTYVHFEVVIVEDGSSKPCLPVVEKYQHLLSVRYFRIENSGPGPARNYGALQSRGEYLLILDSDCVLPASYIEQVHDSLNHSHADAFGGPDRAHVTFSPIQKAINYSMTSFFTTGGIRGGKKKLDKFYPRSFNMGIRREVFLALGGFSEMRYGEDIDFSIRIMKAGYLVCLFPAAWVYHKRRANFSQFFRQVQHSGLARIELYHKYPDSLKPVHCLPALFTLGMAAIGMLAFLIPAILGLVLIFAFFVHTDALVRNKNLKVSLLAVIASFVLLFGYGTGFVTGICCGIPDKRILV